MGRNKNYRTIMHLPDHDRYNYNKRDPEIHNEMSIDVLFCGVAGNGVRVCHHGD